MPGLLQYQTDKRPSSTSTSQTPISDNSEDIELWLPSRVEGSARRRICREGLPKIEERLRTVQLEDALEGIRHILKIKARLVAFKNKNIRGQREGTRSRTIIDRVHQKARSAAEKYRAARLGKLKLSGPGDWERTYQVLLDKDIRGYQDANALRIRVGRCGVLEDGQLEALAASAVSADPNTPPADLSLFPDARTRRDGTGETRRTLSWIWTAAVQNSASDDISDDILRSEWAKSRARATRSAEEVMLLKEEMRRTLAFLDWRGRWWRGKNISWAQGKKDLWEGLNAYMEDQASIQDSLSAHFSILWMDPLSDGPADAATNVNFTSAPEGVDDDDGDDDEEDEHVNDDDLEDD